MISVTSGSWIRCAIGRRDGRMTSKLMSQDSVRDVVEVAGLHVEVVRFQVAVRRRLRIEAVVWQDDGLRVLELRKDLRLEHVVEQEAVRLRGTDGGPVRGRTTGHMADAGALPRLRNRVARLEALGLPAQIRRHARAEVVRQRQEDLRPESLEERPPRLARERRAERADALGGDDRNALRLSRE